MRHSKLKLCLATATTAGIALTFAASPAMADYAPGSGDFVGVGSDTVQYAGDFVADGDNLGDPGVNAGKLNKVINFDATPDANARLAYGPDGVGNGSSTACAPGTGATSGTGSTGAKHKDQPCTLNPTIVLQAGTKPVQRPNGSGAGAKALENDPNHYIGYSRASSAQAPGAAFDSITIGTDNLQLIALPSGSGGHAVSLSRNQLHQIYLCDDGTTNHTPVTWSEVGGTSSDAIIPLVPQVGSGTRQTFLKDIGLASGSGSAYTESTLGTCVQTSEENDPTAIAAQSNPADAIEPMSSGRLNMFQGKLPNGSASGAGGYFLDPSCASNVINTATSNASPCYPGTGAAQTGATDILNPNVAFLTAAVSGSAGLNTGTYGATTYIDTRNLYIYFRDADITSSTPAQPTGAAGANWVRTLLYDPCVTSGPNATTPCTTDPIAGPVGKYGTPFYATTSGQLDIEAAGITPAYAVTLGGP